MSNEMSKSLGEARRKYNQAEAEFKAAGRDATKKRMAQDAMMKAGMEMALFKKGRTGTDEQVNNAMDKLQKSRTAVGKAKQKVNKLQKKYAISEALLEHGYFAMGAKTFSSSESTVIKNLKKKGYTVTPEELLAARNDYEKWAKENPGVPYSAYRKQIVKQIGNAKNALYSAENNVKMQELGVEILKSRRKGYIAKVMTEMELDWRDEKAVNSLLAKKYPNQKITVTREELDSIIEEAQSNPKFHENGKPNKAYYQQYLKDSDGATHGSGGRGGQDEQTDSAVREYKDIAGNVVVTETKDQQGATQSFTVKDYEQNDQTLSTEEIGKTGVKMDDIKQALDSGDLKKALELLLNALMVKQNNYDANTTTVNIPNDNNAVYKATLIGKNNVSSISYMADGQEVTLSSAMFQQAGVNPNVEAIGLAKGEFAKSGEALAQVAGKNNLTSMIYYPDSQHPEENRGFKVSRNGTEISSISFVNGNDEVIFSKEMFAKTDIKLSDVETMIKEGKFKEAAAACNNVLNANALKPKVEVMDNAIKLTDRSGQEFVLSEEYLYNQGMKKGKAKGTMKKFREAIETGMAPEMMVRAVATYFQYPFLDAKAGPTPDIPEPKLDGLTWVNPKLNKTVVDQSVATFGGSSKTTSITVDNGSQKVKLKAEDFAAHLQCTKKEGKALLKAYARAMEDGAIMDDVFDPMAKLKLEKEQFMKKTNSSEFEEGVANTGKKIAQLLYQRGFSEKDAQNFFKNMDEGRKAFYKQAKEQGARFDNSSELPNDSLKAGYEIAGNLYKIGYSEEDAKKFFKDLEKAGKTYYKQAQAQAIQQAKSNRGRE